MVRHVENLKRQELLVEYYTGYRGYSINREKTTKKYICIDIRPDVRLFLGHSGAVRKGTSVSSSISLTDTFTEPQLNEIRRRVQEHRDSLRSPNKSPI